MDSWVAIVVVAVAIALGRLLMWIGGIKEHKSEATKFMKEIRKDIKKVLLRLPPIPAAETSPCRLAGYGERIRDEVGATAWAEQEADILRPRVASKEPYEIEEISVAHAREASLSPEMRRAAYENGFSHEHIRVVLGLELRDELIALPRTVLESA